MKLEYPVFICDRDGWVNVLHEPKQLEGIEEIDAEEEGLHGWDSQGRPFEIGVDNHRAVIRSVVPVSDLPGLREGILGMAAMYGVRAQVENECGHIDTVAPLTLLEATERLRPGGRWRVQTARWSTVKFAIRAAAVGAIIAGVLWSIGGAVMPTPLFWVGFIACPLWPGVAMMTSTPNNNTPLDVIVRWGVILMFLNALIYGAVGGAGHMAWRAVSRFMRRPQ